MVELFFSFPLFVDILENAFYVPFVLVFFYGKQTCGSLITKEYNIEERKGVYHKNKPSLPKKFSTSIVVQDQNASSLPQTKRIKEEVCFLPKVVNGTTRLYKFSTSSSNKTKLQAPSLKQKKIKEEASLLPKVANGTTHLYRNLLYWLSPILKNVSGA